MTPSATTVLQPGMRHYRGTRQVRQVLRNLPDTELERVYVGGLKERKRGGPKDGDQARSDFLFKMAEAEVDRRMDTGPHWTEGLDAQ